MREADTLLFKVAKRRNKTHPAVRKTLVDACGSEQRKQLMDYFAGSPGSGCQDSGAVVDSCICGRSGKASWKDIIQCGKCGKTQHRRCMSHSAALTPYECPCCQIERMDAFFPVLGVLVAPAKVRTAVGKVQDCEEIKKVSSDQHREGIMVQVRCVRLDGRGYEHVWPEQTILTLNNTKVMELHPHTSTSSRRRKDYPLDLGLRVALDPHTIGVWKQKDHCEYAFAVVLTAKRTAATILQEVMCSSGTSDWISIAKVAMDDCDGVSVETMRVSAVCPLTRLAMEVPGRGWKCCHLQCFDLAAFITLQEDSTCNRWKCPVCQKNCAVLVKDEFMAAVLAQVKQSGDCSTIEFRRNGEFSLVPKEPFKSVPPSPVNYKRKSCSPLPSSGKLPKVISLSDSLQANSPLSWSDFLSQRVPSERLYESEVYAKIGSAVALMWRRALQQPKRCSVGRVSTSSLSTVRCSAAVSKEGGSAAFPIDLED